MSFAHITGPCGHKVDLDDAFIARDKFHCPICGLAWRVDQAPPIRTDWGTLIPGDRTVVIEPQLNLPIPLPSRSLSAIALAKAD